MEYLFEKKVTVVVNYQIKLPKGLIAFYNNKFVVKNHPQFVLSSIYLLNFLIKPRFQGKFIQLWHSQPGSVCDSTYECIKTNSFINVIFCTKKLLNIVYSLVWIVIYYFRKYCKVCKILCCLMFVMRWYTIIVVTFTSSKCTNMLLTLGEWSS